MFGQKDDQPANDPIPDQTVDAVMNDDGQGGQPAPEGPAETPPQVVTPSDPPTDGGIPQTPPQPPEPPHIDDVSPGHGGGFAPPRSFLSDAPARDDSTSHSDDNGSATTHELIDIKQQALTKLSPLLGQLDQSAEERFRTTMMMIQASDDSSLISKAYEAAQEIQDEKARAQALLDIVNEINYFTQPSADS